ncbi:hypothetical protein FRC19_004478 [Serendipita sp. 401]|nr:hypothetical protein FRC15_004420 [Serendipita sp. 397]KAG8827272.1 hypothetical protein FRC19_004478 [Serendipita sp. 401]KAG8839380.1 hypothetical protein FRC18_011491 [Serendipita sp. 400]
MRLLIRRLSTTPGPISQLLARDWLRVNPRSTVTASKHLLTPLAFQSRSGARNIASGVGLGSSNSETLSGDSKPRAEHAVISTFDLFSIGIGPSSSHTVGPMRAGRIFVHDLKQYGLLEKVKNIKITLYGSLAATGKGHHTPQAILLGLEGSDPETVETSTVNARYEFIRDQKTLNLAGKHRIHYDMDRDMLWRMEQLPTHPNGMRFTVFDENGDPLATNEYYSVGGGFVVNEKTKVDENLYYMGVDKSKVDPSRRSQIHEFDGSNPGDSDGNTGQPQYLFKSGDTLLAMSKKHNMTIAQLVYDNELYYLTEEQIHAKLMRIWQVMDECIRTGVSTSEKVLPGRLGLRRRAPLLYQRLMRGFYPGLYSGSTLPAIGSGSSLMTPAINAPAINIDVPDSPNPSSPIDQHEDMTSRKAKGPKGLRVVGSLDHPVLPMPPKRTVFPNIDFLSCYAIAVNEVNAAGGRIVTSPTNGAAGVIPAVLKYTVEFISDDTEKTVETFLLTAAAIGMLFKRGSTISAAEGGCQAEVGVACSMAAGAFAACMGASPEVVLQAAEIGIEHNLGLTCDPIDGLVQVPCIERNSLGAVKAITAAQLAMATDAVHSVSLDEAIEAMRLTAADMSIKYKETSLSGLAVCYYFLILTKT